MTIISIGAGSYRGNMNLRVGLGIILILFLSILHGCADGDPSDALPPPSPGESDVCSQSSPSGVCPNEDEACVEGICVSIEEDGEPEEEQAEENSNNRVEEEKIDSSEDDDDGDEDSGPAVYINPAIFKFGKELKRIPKIAWPFNNARTGEQNSDGPPNSERDASQDDQGPSCSLADLVAINKKGQHGQCMLDTGLGFNYTDSPWANYGICQLIHDSKPISKKQFIYKPNNATIDRHEALYECVIMMSCYEGLWGTDIQKLIDEVEDGGLSSNNIEIFVQTYVNNELYEESDMGNISNAAKILAFEKMPIDDEIISHTKEYMDDYIDAIESECL